MANPSEPDAAWVTLARLVKTQGRRGEFAAEVLSDVPGRFAQLRQVWLCHPSGRRLPVHLVRHWPHLGRLVLGFEEISDLNAAEPWVGATVQVPDAERLPAPEGSYYVDELAGCAVLDAGRLLGTIAAVEPLAGAAPLLHVRTPAGGELLIPFVEAFLESVSIPERRVVMRLPEGLTEINSA